MLTLLLADQGTESSKSYVVVLPEHGGGEMNADSEETVDVLVITVSAVEGMTITLSIGDLSDRGVLVSRYPNH
jgi:hypothetical protein